MATTTLSLNGAAAALYQVKDSADRESSSTLPACCRVTSKCHFSTHSFSCSSDTVGSSFSFHSTATANRSLAVHASGEEAASTPSGRIITGPCFVLDDNIDTDQIIPAEYLTLVPSKPEEYEKLGSYAMAGLPAKYPRYMNDGATKTKFPIVIGGYNFGCGSSREHAPVAMGAAGCKVVVAESYARIFFRNCVATGELYPVESEERICEVIKMGDEVTVDMEHDLLIHHPSGKQFALKPIGEAGPVIDAGGIFNYARATGMIAAKS